MAGKISTQFEVDLAALHGGSDDIGSRLQVRQKPHTIGSRRLALFVIGSVAVAADEDQRDFTVVQGFNRLQLLLCLLEGTDPQDEPLEPISGTEQIVRNRLRKGGVDPRRNDRQPAIVDLESSFAQLAFDMRPDDNQIRKIEMLLNHVERGRSRIEEIIVRQQYNGLSSVSDAAK